VTHHANPQVQQCGPPNAFQVFSLTHSRTGEEGSFVTLAFNSDRLLSYGVFTEFPVTAIEELVPPEVLSACLSPAGLTPAPGTGGQLLLAQAGDSLEMAIRTSRTVQVETPRYSRYSLPYP
jgi:hypothetical protein